MTTNSGCDWSPRRRAPSILRLLPPGVERDVVTPFAGPAELRVVRLLSKRHLHDVAGEAHWRALCAQLWRGKPDFANRRTPFWGVFARSNALALADRALRSSSDTPPPPSFVRVALSPPRSHDLAPHETCRRLTWRESHGGSLRDAMRDEIAAQELERWPWTFYGENERNYASFAFESQGLRHGGTVFMTDPRHRVTWNRETTAVLAMQGLRWHVVRKGDWGWRLRRIGPTQPGFNAEDFWDASRAAAVVSHAVGLGWRRDGGLGVE
jgi:hypothetical protein